MPLNPYLPKIGDESCPPLGRTCPSSPFDRLIIYRATAGGTQVFWEINNGFFDPRPWVFQLQVGRGVEEWTNVGSPIEDGYYAVDPSPREFGKTPWTHYRVRLETPKGTYYSEPTAAQGVLSRKEWAIAKSIVRQKILRLQKLPCGQDGYLLRRRTSGEICSCVDFGTEQPVQPGCLICFETGWVGGYFSPIDCLWIEMGLIGGRGMKTLDRGSTRDVVVPDCRIPGNPIISSFDVWVDRNQDLRWMIHDVRSISEMRGVPLELSASFRLVEFTNPIYQFEIQGQRTSL